MNEKKNVQTKDGRMNEVSSREKKTQQQHENKTSESESINLVRSLKNITFECECARRWCVRLAFIVSKVESDANVRVGGLVRQWALPHRSPE